MTYWTEQALDLMKTWTETQRKLWEGWFDLAGQSGSEQKGVAGDWFAQWQEATRKSIETWQTLTDRSLDAQAEWVKTDNFASMFPQGSEEARKLTAAWSEQTVSIMRTWAESQRRLWGALFDLATNVGQTEKGVAGDWFGQWEKMTRQSLASWDELVKQAMETQRTWVDSLATNGVSATASPKPGSGAKKPAGGEV